MDDSALRDLRGVLGSHEKLIYEAVKAGGLADLSPEDQLLALAMQAHMHLKHVHNALEFADVREGELYEIEVQGQIVNPMAHVAAHAAVKGQIEEDPAVKAALEKMVATGASPHHAEHVLCALLMEFMWEGSQPGATGESSRSAYLRKIKKLSRDSAYRKKLTRKFPPDHAAFE